MAVTRRDEGPRKCCLDNVRIWSSGPAKKSGGLVKNRHSGAPEGAPAANMAGGRLLGGALVVDAPKPALRSLMGARQERKAQAQRQ